MSQTYGVSHPLYARWAGMKQRCTNPNHTLYHRYGGRGIRVCSLWMSSFESYARHLEDLGWLQGDRREVDRINNDGDYEPGNVRLATRLENQQNKAPRWCKIVEAWGERKSINAWAKDPRAAPTAATIARRLRAGEPPERAISRPGRRGRGGSWQVQIWGEEKTIQDWCDDARIPVACGTVYKRLGRGWPLGEALLTPSRALRRVCGVNVVATEMPSGRC